ncbi:hypothetical protein [Saccharopolyspora phatthalungensis]|uniref:Uncharacterized protein n=1 Tax=Saccharopolyspora phatthalungensis TaxID=664693 RepID=A0A840PWI5_9PSEU|nr:hypothetical protein [Saccharopolyspora phatthalungensis]MBB5154642.1 hypothetical protein [Saccharopolyspora phatthalungensis]
MNPPRPLRRAIILWWVVALVLAWQTALMWVGRAELAQRLIEQHQATPADAAGRAQQLLLVNTGFAVLLAAAYLVLGALLFKRRPWARIVLSAFAVVHLFMLLGTGAVFSVNVILLILGAAATVLMWWRSSTDWLTGEHD